MKRLLKSTTTALVGLSLVWPTMPAHAQGELPQCSAKFRQAELPCRMGGRTARDIEDWRVLDLIRQGKAETQEEARAIIAKRRAGGTVTGIRKEPEIPQCGPQVDNTPLPCLMGKRLARNPLEWQILDLIATGQAANDPEARAILKARREGAGEVAQESDSNGRETQPEVATRPQVAQCAKRAGNLTFPCQVGDRQARDETEWRILRLIASGQAANDPEARAILQQRREERRAERASAAAAAAAADESMEAGETETVTQDTVRQSDEEFSTSVTSAGRDSTAGQGDSGLSKFEKALLLGLGAVVVGSVLKNGDKVVSRTGDRVVVESPTGDLRVLKDDDALIRRPGDSVQSQTFDDGSTRSIVTKPDGSQVITVRGRDGSVLQRVNIDPQGNRYVIIDDTVEEEAVEVRDLPQIVQRDLQASNQSEDALRRALAAQMQASQTRRFSLRQVREISQVRALAPELELDAVRFESGSAAIRPEQARALANLGGTLRRLVAEDPRTVFLIEGHTDAVGDETYNLALSDRRAETVALALTEYFDVPPANLVTQGYGESALKVLTLSAEAVNRRAVVRNISGLLR